MKVKKTLPDGTVVEVEGTAEEVAEWERSQKNESKAGKSPKKLLNEGLVLLTEISKKLDLLLEKQCVHVQAVPAQWPQLPECPWYDPVNPFGPTYTWGSFSAEKSPDAPTLLGIPTSLFA